MGAGGESHHANFVWRHAKFLGASADDTNGPLSVAQLDGVVIARPDAIFHDECDKAHGVEPIGGLAAFVVGSEILVAAARENDHGRGRTVSR